MEEGGGNVRLDFWLDGALYKMIRNLVREEGEQHTALYKSKRKLEKEERACEHTALYQMICNLVRGGRESMPAYCPPQDGTQLREGRD